MSPLGAKAISSAVERQMRNWEIARQQTPPSSDPSTPVVNPFVTISRMVGSGGGEVARKLAERVGWPLFDREVLRYMAGDDAVRKRLYETMDERDIGFVEESLRSFTSTEIKRNDYFHRLTETILTITRQGNAIFLGRGADLVLPRGAGLRVRTVSLPAACVQRYALEQSTDTVQAARDLARIERDRSRFLHQHFNVELDTPDRFDMVLNLAAVGIDEAVHLIAEMIKVREMT